MRHLPLLLLAACGPTAASFQSDYARRYCEVLDEQCPPAQLPELCRSIGTAPLENPYSICDFDGFAAMQCMEPARWSCNAEDEVVVPEVCASVWVCPET